MVVDETARIFFHNIIIMHATTMPAPRRAAAASLLLLYCCSQTVAFQIHGSVGPHAHDGSRTTSTPLIVPLPVRSGRIAFSQRQSRPTLYAKNDDGGDGGSNERVPFFARLANAYQKAKQVAKQVDVETKDSQDASEGGVALAVKEEEGDKHESLPGAGVVTTIKSPEELATEFRMQAEKAKLEALQMETTLTIEKISKLEKLLESKTLKEDEEKVIRSQLAVLKTKLDGPKTTNGEEANGSAQSKSDEDDSSDEDISSLIDARDLKGEKKSAADRDLEKQIPPISDEELRQRSEAFRKTPKVLQQMTAAAAGFKETSNVTGIIKQMHKDEQMEILKKEQKKSQPSEPMSDEAREQALEGYMNLPLPIQDMIARTAGLKDGRNATEVIAKLETEGRLFPNENGMQAGFEVTSDIVDSEEIDVIFKDMERMEKDKYIEGMLPRQTRKVELVPTEDDIDVFFSEVLSNKNFNPTGKPENIPGGYLIRGENKMKDGDELVKTLDKALAATNVSDKVQFYYLKDPNPSTEEEFQRYENDLPVLVVTGPDISPETKYLTKAFISLIGIVFVASFSVGALSFNEVLVDRLDAEVQAGTADLSWVQDLAAPTFLAVCATQLVHEASHQAVAYKDKFKAGLPTILPSLQTGLSGAITPLKTSPPNLKSLFDFSMAGPLSGLIISLFFMYSGLELTAFMGPDAQSQLPSLPLQLLRSSALSGGMVEWLLGEGILAPGGGTMLLHPFAIAGFVGLVSNAIALLPIGSKYLLTDLTRALVVIASCSMLLTLCHFTASLTLCFNCRHRWRSYLTISLRQEVGESHQWTVSPHFGAEWTLRAR